MIRRYISHVFLMSWTLWFLAALLLRVGTPSVVSNSLLLAGILMPAVMAFTTPVHGEKNEPTHIWRTFIRSLIPRSAFSSLIILPIGAWIAFCFSITLGDGLDIQATLRYFTGYFVVLLLSGGLEEIGWRGLLQPGLMERFGPLQGTVMTGLIWGVWHLPLWLIPDTFQSAHPFWLVLIAGVTLSAAFQLSYSVSESLTVPILLHMFYNAFLTVHFDTFSPDTNFIVSLLIGGSVSLILLILFLKKNIGSGVDVTHSGPSQEERSRKNEEGT